MNRNDLEAIAALGLRLLACTLVFTALALYIHTALSDSFLLRQIPEELAAAGVQIRTGEATSQTAALLGATGLFLFVLSRGLARLLLSGLHPPSPSKPSADP